MCNKQVQSSNIASLGLNRKHLISTKKLAGRLKKATRKKLWELDHHFYCSVIGTCLTLRELRNIARKCKQDVINTASDYELHHWFVMASTESSAISKILNKKLEHKFARDIRLTNQLHTEVELMSYWNKAKSDGNVAGPYWTLITRPDTSEQVLDQIYGDIHMLSHLAGATCRVEQQTFKNTQSQNIELQQALGRLRIKTMTLQVEKETVSKKLEAEKKLHYQAQKKLTEVQTLLKEFTQKPEITALHKLTESLSDQLSHANRENNLAQQDATVNRKTIQQQERQIQRLNSRLEKQMTNWWQQAAVQTEKTCPLSGENNEAGCPHPDLYGRKILYVGGHITSCPHLKSATEIVNGCFLYHDGGLEENPHKLTAALQQADVVFFPVNCVSHEASNRVKDFCNHAKKPLIQLKSSGISSFKESLHQFAQQEFHGEPS